MFNMASLRLARLILAFLTLAVSAGVFAHTLGTGTITNFRLTRCGVVQCFSVKAPEASTGFLGTGYYAESATLTVTNKTTNTRMFTLSAAEIYFDDIHDSLVIRDIAGRHHGDALYEANTERIYYFDKKN